MDGLGFNKVGFDADRLFTGSGSQQREAGIPSSDCSKGPDVILAEKPPYTSLLHGEGWRGGGLAVNNR